MRTLTILQLLLLPLATLIHESSAAFAQTAPKPNPSAQCNPWSTSYWGDAVIESQADADEFACFRRIVGKVTLIPSSEAPFVLPTLHGIVGSMRVAFPRTATREAAATLAAMLPALREVTGEVELQYTGVDGDVRAAFAALGLERFGLRGNVRVAVQRREQHAAAISDTTVRR